VPAGTVPCVLVRRGPPRLAALAPMTGAMIRSSKVTAVRYERARPGELVHMDATSLACIPGIGGWRAHGGIAVTVDRTRAQRPEKRDPKDDQIHSLVDDHSRLACSEILPDAKGSTCAALLIRAAADVADHGTTWIYRVMPDNALELTRFDGHPESWLAA
jgi:hypothetical protein